jgi:hypothetical protein
MSHVNAIKIAGTINLFFQVFVGFNFRGSYLVLSLWVSNALTAHEVDILIYLGPVSNASSQ